MRPIARYLPVLLVMLTGCASAGAQHPRATPAVAVPNVGPAPSYGDAGRVEEQAAGIGRTEKFETLFASFPVRARIIVPHGHANGRGGYNWWDHPVPHTDPEVLSAAVRPMEAQMANAIVELRARRPTIGRPVVTGFSQGGMLAFSLAAMHPDLVAAAFPMGGLLPIGLPGIGVGATRPYVHAFHGTRDGTVPVTRTRWSIDELRRNGYAAELTEYPALGHQLGDEEVRTVFAQMAALVSRPGGP
jgi:phospholipase/carboxylesterase